MPWLNVVGLTVLAAVTSGLAAFVAGAIAGMPLRRANRGGELPWHERARLAYPLVKATNRIALTALLLVPLLAMLGDAAVAHVSGGLLWALLVAVVFRSIRSALRPFRLEREKRPRLPFRKACKAVLFLVLLYARLPILVAMTLLMGPRLDLQSFMVLAIGGAGLVLFSTGFWLRLARAAQIVGTPSPRLITAARTAAERVGAHAPAIFQADLPGANAFAIPGEGTLVVTTPTLALLDDEELVAICAHEMGHLTESKTANRLRPFSIVALLPIVFFRPIHQFFEPGLTGILEAALACLVAAMLGALVVKALLHRSEARADRIAHANEGASGVYARALEKLHREADEPLTFTKDPRRRKGLLARLFARDPHGSFAERVHALGGELPPGLVPPSRGRFIVALAAGVVVLIAGMIGSVLAIEVAPGLASDDERRLQIAVGLQSQGFDELASLGSLREMRGDFDAAIAFKRAAAALSPHPSLRISLAATLLNAGRLDEAAAELDEADRQDETFPGGPSSADFRAAVRRDLEMRRELQRAR